MDGYHHSLHAQTNYKLISLSAQSSPPMFPSAATPPHFVTTPPLSPNKIAIPKSSLPYWSSVSDRDQAKSFIRRLSALDPPHRRAQEALCDPWFTPTDAPSHVDSLRQNWSPRAKRIVLTGVWATNRFTSFAAAASRSSTQSN